MILLCSSNHGNKVIPVNSCHLFSVNYNNLLWLDTRPENVWLLSKNFTKMVVVNTFRALRESLKELAR